MTVLALNPSLRLYRGQTGYYTVFMADHATGQAAVSPLFDINEAGKGILQCVDGSRDNMAVADEYCARVNAEPGENSDWICAFLDTMLAHRAVLPVDSLAPGETGCAELPVLGTGGHSKPLHASIEITETCNLKCAHCYLESSPLARTRMSLEDFTRLVAEMRDQDVITVELTGGEGFMHPDAVQMIKLACDSFARVGLLTNGTFIPEEAITVLADNKAKTLVGISLDSVHPEVHDRFRGGRGAFDKTCRNIKRLASRGIFVRVGTSIFEENRWEIADMAELALSLGAKAFGFNFIEDLGRGRARTEDQALRYDQDYDQYVKGVIQKYKDIIPIIPLESPGPSSRKNCGAGTFSMTIGADGQARPCNLFPKTTAIGNALLQGWEDTYMSPVALSLANVPSPSIENGCPLSCPSLPLCWGCYLKGLQANIGRPPDDYCPWMTTNGLQDYLPILSPVGSRMSA